MTWLPPELEDGAEPELKPLEPVLFELEPVPEFELDPVELEPEPEVEPDPGLAEPEDVESSSEPGLAELEPVAVEALAACVDPGRAKANAPAAATLATVTVAVAVLTLVRPRSLVAMARRTPSRSLLMNLSLGSGFPGSLREPSL